MDYLLLTDLLFTSEMSNDKKSNVCRLWTVDYLLFTNEMSNVKGLMSVDYGLWTIYYLLMKCRMSKSLMSNILYLISMDYRLWTIERFTIYY